MCWLLLINFTALIRHQKLSTYFKDSVKLSLFPGETDRVKYIRPDVG